MDFNDRFGSTLINVNLETITIEQLTTVSPLLADMVNIVRGFSVLIRRKTIQEIYDVIVNQSDPRIALILAAARDNNGNQLFPTLSIVKAVMFGRNDDTVVTSDFTYNDKSIFVNGIKRISCALTASYLIGQLSQVPEQANHAISLEKQTLEDLDRIIKVPELKNLTQSLQDNNKLSKPRFYFEPTKINLNTQTLVTSIYLSSSDTIWETVGTYTGNVNLTQIISDISDYINTSTLVSNTSNILSSSILNGDNKLHILEFGSRLRDKTINTELVSISFKYLDSSENMLPIPFKWGVDAHNLYNYSINSCIIEVNDTGSTGSVNNQNNDKLTLDTVYFRRRLADDQNNPITLLDGQIDTIEYRVSPNQTETTVIDIEYIEAESSNRPNLVATSLLNSLFESKDATKLLGAIIQNMPDNIPNSYTALQIVPWSITTREVNLILDILVLPPDIEIALGDSYKPQTAFSNKPRSLKVTSTIDNLESIVGDVSDSTKVKLILSRQSKLLAKYNDVKESNYKSYRNLYKPYINIPSPPNNYEY